MQRKMCCEHHFICTDSTKVCVLCGKETAYLECCTYANCGFSVRHSPFLSGYSRTKRFRGMVDALFWPTPSNPDTKALKYLSNKTLTSRQDIIEAISTAPLKDKRFGSIHIFCRLFDPHYQEPTHGCLFQMLKRMVTEFGHIEARFQQVFTNEPFINYTYLIRHLLSKLGFVSYLPFVKTLKCEKRKAKYNNMLDVLSRKHKVPTVQVCMEKLRVFLE